MEHDGQTASATGEQATVAVAASGPPPTAADDRALIGALRGPVSRYWLTRSLYLRALGFIYSVAFLVLHDQLLPLLGKNGLEPAAYYVDELRQYTSFWRVPTLFWWDASDRVLVLAANLGLVLALLVLCGVENAAVLGALWLLYLSFVHVGQVFYGYGWESLLLEAGFLAIFMAPWLRIAPLRDRTPPAFPLLFMLRWLLFRLMFGAGLIKLRTDPCWRDLSCLAYHYETQPNPHPLSWLLHQAPLWFHQLGTAFNHFVEVLVPWFVFGPRRARQTAGALIIAFQTMLILSGNLSFLNWLTIAIAIGCFDDSFWARILPRAVAARAERCEQVAPPQRGRIWSVRGLCALVLVLSYAPIVNMLSPHQRMNTSFDPLQLVNSYGAFGSVGKVRDEVILEGTHAERPDAQARWLPYEFKCKPGAVGRRPCWITPYHYRLDWQMWFAALSDAGREPWIVHLIYKLLHNDAGMLSLIANQPFPDKPPRYIRAERYRYHFTHLGDGSRDWWKRERVDSYLPPLSLDDPRLREFLLEQGFVRGKR